MGQGDGTQDPCPIGPGPGPSLQKCAAHGPANALLGQDPGPMAADVGPKSYGLVLCPMSYGPVLRPMAVSYVLGVALSMAPCPMSHGPVL